MSRPFTPTEGDELKKLDFCNAFWNPGGVETLLDKMRVGGKTLGDLAKWYSERASIEEEYAKKLGRLAKQSLGKEEMGTIRGAIDTLRAELNHTAQSHLELSGKFKGVLEAQLVEFATRREGSKKSTQAGVEKLYKTKKGQEELCVKSRKKFEEDCITINGLTAQTSLIQGRDLDKVSSKLDKAQQTVMVNERDYQNYVRALKDTTYKWNLEWKKFCDLCQDLEEERIDYLKSSLWEYANAVSTVCVDDDESCERLRVRLEGTDTSKDIRTFVRERGTGAEVADPPPYVNFAKGETIPAKPAYSLASFTRSSTHQRFQPNASAVQDLANTISRSRPETPAAEESRSQSRAGSVSPTKQHRKQPSDYAPPQPYPATPGTGPQAGPPPKQPDVPPQVLKDLQTFTSPSPTETDPEVPDHPRPNAAGASTPGDAIQAAVSRGPASSVAAEMRSASPATSERNGSGELARRYSTSRGVIPASAFQNRSNTNLAERKTPTHSPGLQQGGSGTGTGEPDALEAALEKLKSNPAGASGSIRSPNSAGPAPGAVALPGMTGPKSTTGAGGSRPTSPNRSHPPSRSGSAASQRQQQAAVPKSSPGGSATAAPGSSSGGATSTNGQRSGTPFGISLDANGSVVENQHQQQQQQQQQQSPQPQQHPGAPSPNTSGPGPHPPNMQQPGQMPYGYQPVPGQPGYPYGQPMQQMPGMPANQFPPNGYPGGQQPYYGQPMPNQMYQQQMYQQQMPPQQQPRAPSPSPQGAAPTGQYTDDGQPILFYVQALYEYTPQPGEDQDLSFSTGAVIAVTRTEPDGWWYGNLVGTDQNGSFPSNFVDHFT